MLSVSEYGRIFLADKDEALDDGNLLLREEHFRAVMTLLEQDEDEAPDYTPIFTYLRPKGKEQLKVQSYVGVIRLADGVQIEVLPKIAKRLDPEAARELLIKMLVELRDSPFFEGTAADLRAHKMPLFELILRCFLEQVVTIVRKGVARTYVEKEDNLVFLRGKIRLAEHLRRNSYNASRIYCQYDEYDVDRPINRLVKGALEIARRQTRDAMNQQLCRELMYWFDEVPATQSYRTDFMRMQRDRLVQHYASAMPLCRLILEQLNPLTRQGENQVVSMLFPMERVFEAYVSAKVRRQFPGWKVFEQYSGEALVEQHINRKMFNLRPDLVFSCAGVKVVADTKWKLIDQSNRGKSYGISQSDIYQLFGYSRKYLRDQVTREVMLVYPASDSFKLPLRPFWYRESSEVLHVVPYDLNNETLILPTGSLLNEDVHQTVAS